MEQRPKPLVLIILDGWGYSESAFYNAIHTAQTPVWDSLWQSCPHTLISTSGADVGLPAEQMGNSEVGHLNLGAGRVVFQEYTRVGDALADGSFYTNPVFTGPVDEVIARERAVHVVGLLSPGGVHSHEGHMHAMVRLAVERGAPRVYVHAFLDGRDTAPKSAQASIERLERTFAEVGGGRFASVIGRYYAMDRDRRWERTRRAYDLLTGTEAACTAPSAGAALAAAYERGETDEFVEPTAIAAAGESPAAIADGDAVFLMNYRADRARQITRPFIEPDFDAFERQRRPALAAFVTLTQYSNEFDNPVAYPATRPRNGLGEHIARLGLRQLRLAETEKYAHVTFFLNGGREEPFEGEDRILVPSPKVATYDLQPEMSAAEVTDHLVEAIESRRYDVVICNYANPDMVGHTGDFDVAVKAIETVDTCLGRVVEAARARGGEVLISADHGNAEQMRDAATGQPHTAHTTNPVPLIYVGRRARPVDRAGTLADVAPTMLYLMGCDKPDEMTGQTLLELVAPEDATG